MSPLLHTVRNLSEMGRREIARSSSACLRILLGACGAGFVTAGTVLIKLVALPSFMAVNYIGSFLLMQLAGFRLATKQAPLLGAALGAAAGPMSTMEDWRWSLRTQLTSAGGNLVVVAVASFLLQWVAQRLGWIPSLDARRAREILMSLHPTESSSLVHAAFTGGLLWFCTLLGGMVGSRAPRFSRALVGVTFNISLGVLLGFLPLIGKSLDLPIDVRHFALSGGMTAMSAAVLGFKEAWGAGLAAAIAGVLAIGALNFGVSFLLAFYTASVGGMPTRAFALEVR